MKSFRTLILLGLLIFVLGVSYPILSKSTDPTTAEEQEAAVREAETLLAQVQAINLDFSVLQGNEFNHLKDITVPLLNLPVGRVNPFAPGK
jgi:hypothetical protein